MPRFHLSPAHLFRRRARLGFSLVEMSVVVIIVSIVAVLGLEMGASYMDRTAYKTTAARLEAIDAALVAFQRTHGFLPCPGATSITPDCSCYGKALYGDGGTAGVSCGGTYKCGLYATATCNAATYASGSVSYGDVPVRDLGLPLSYMLDGWGMRLRYAVSSAMTTTPAAYEAAGAEALRIYSGRIGLNCGVSAACQYRGMAAYAVLSHGNDRRGAYTPNGQIFSSCAGSPTADYDGMIDTANCRFGSAVSLHNGSATVAIPAEAFYDSRYNTGTQEQTHFDDLIVWRPRSRI